MKGAGSWDEYCYCCGLPFSKPSLTSKEHNYSLLEDRKLSKNELNQINSEGPSIESLTGWLNESIGLASYHNLRFNLNNGGDTGDMFMSKTQTNPGAKAFYNDSTRIFITGDMVAEMSDEYKDDSAIGIAIHRACAEILEEAIGRSLVPADEKAIRALKTGNARSDGLCLTEYNQQFFAWSDAVINEPASFFSDPTKNAERKQQILLCAASFIKAVKKGGKRKTRKASNKK